MTRPVLSALSGAPQSAADLDVIAGLAGAPLPPAYRALMMTLGATVFDPPREILYAITDTDGTERHSAVAVLEWLGRAQIETALMHWFSEATGACLPPQTLPIALDGAFNPVLLGFGPRAGVWYLPEPVAHLWSLADDPRLHLLRTDFDSFLQDFASDVPGIQ